MNDHPTRRAGGGRRDQSARTSATPGRHGAIHLEADIVRELHATARPGKGDILVKVFGEAAAAFMADDLDEAIRLGEQAKHLALRSGAVREFLGQAYYGAGKWSEAGRELAAFRRLSGSTEQNPLLADAYRAMGKPEKAIELCGEVDARSATRPVFFEAAIVAAGALADLGRLDEAIARLEALDLRPPVVETHHIRAWYALGDLLERRGRFTQAREYFDAAAAADDMTDAVERAARLRSRG
jgi:tetratricopeptide (TPR) repeat protein